MRANATPRRLRSGASSGREMTDILGDTRFPQAAAATKASPPMTLWLRTCRRLSPRPCGVEAYQRLFLLVAELLFPCNFGLLCAPARVHPDPVGGVLAHCLFDGPGRCGGERQRVGVALAGARAVDAAERNPMHASRQPMSAGEEHRRVEVRGQIAGGTRRECGAAKERHQVAPHPGVLVDEDAAQSAGLEEPQDLARPDRRSAA